MSTPSQPESLVLASESPRRARLLREAGYRFEIATPSLSEPQWVHPELSSAVHVESWAYFKASSVAEEHSLETVLAADTVAVLGSEIIGKAADRDEARNILRRLSGTDHAVISGLVLLHPARGRRLMQHDVSMVRVRVLDDAMIEAYLETGKWRGKAGAYGIQEQDDPFVETVEGSFTNVVGLPMELLARMLEHWLQ